MKNILRTSLLLMALLISVTAIAQTSSAAADQASKSTKTTKVAKTKRKAAKNTKAVSATPSAAKPASEMTPAEVAKAAKNAASAPAVAPTAPAAIRMDDATTPAPAGVSITPNAPVAEEAAPAIPLTTIKFAESTFDFGQIKQGETVTHKFKFTNTGSNPLVLENVKPSCGCTAINWPKEPIAPQQTGEIEAQFNSTGKAGDQLKNITITLNTVEHLERLTFTGVVIAPPTDGAAPAHTPGDGHQH